MRAVDYLPGQMIVSALHRFDEVVDQRQGWIEMLDCQCYRRREVLRGECRPRAKKGKRCTTRVKRRALTLSGLAGSNAFKLRLAGLRKGSYTATIIAENANGTSKSVSLSFTITRK